MFCAAALCFRSRPITAELPPSPPGVVPIGFTRTERAKAEEISRLDFHFPAVTAGLAALPRIRDVAVLPWIRELSSWAKHFPMHSPASSRLTVRFLRIWLPSLLPWPVLAPEIHQLHGPFRPRYRMCLKYRFRVRGSKETQIKRC